MQCKKFQDDMVEMEAFKLDKPVGKWLVITYHGPISETLGYCVRWCDELPKTYNHPWTKPVEIKWKKTGGEQAEFRTMHAEEFMAGESTRF